MTKRTNNIPPALRHGVYSGMTLLPGEDRAAFEKSHQEIIAEYNPTGRSEESIVENLCRLMWRRQNLSTYGLAECARRKSSQIYACLSPPFDPSLEFSLRQETRSPEELQALHEKADKEAQVQLGEALELVEAGDVATTDYLLNELSIIERLDQMIDRCLKQLLLVRGLKSISSPSAATSRTPRIGKAA